MYPTTNTKKIEEDRGLKITIKDSHNVMTSQLEKEKKQSYILTILTFYLFLEEMQKVNDSILRIKTDENSDLQCIYFSKGDWRVIQKFFFLMTPIN